MSVSFIEFAGALEIFEPKVLLLGVAVSLVTGLIKLAVPEKARRFVTMFPFIVGIVICSLFAYFFEDAAFFSAHAVSVGIQCGVAATIYYVIYNQFFRGGSGDNAALLSGIIGGIIKKDAQKETVKCLLSALTEGGEGLPKKLFEILKADISEGISTEEIMLAVKNITGIFKKEG